MRFRSSCYSVVRAEVGTEHLLLGMVISNETSNSASTGLFGPSVSSIRSRETVLRVSGRRRESPSQPTPPFTRNARLIFEAARTVWFPVHDVTHSLILAR